MNKYKNRIIGLIAIAAIVIVSFVFGGNIPKESATAGTQAATASPVPFTSSAPVITAPPGTEAPKEVIAPKSTEAPIAEKSAPQPTQITETDTGEDLTCTISITCNTALSNISLLTQSKQDIIPRDGVILAEKTAAFFEGESVFNVLARESRQNNIHLEFVNAPFYNSAYIEGIANLYEFDCGELSGWMYKVNGNFPPFGCSQYTVKKDDRIEWVYTCNSGADVGDNSGTRNGFNTEE